MSYIPMDCKVSFKLDEAADWGRRRGLWVRVRVVLQQGGLETQGGVLAVELNKHIASVL